MCGAVEPQLITVCEPRNNGQGTYDGAYLDVPDFDYHRLKLYQVKSDIDPVKLGEALPVEIQIGD
jgi:hypothetical protein